MTISETAEQLLLSNNFKPAKTATKKKSAWLTPNSQQVFYVNRTSNEGISLFVFHPEQRELFGKAINAAGLELNKVFYHSSNMSFFPKRTHKGKNPIPYGYPVSILRSTNLNQLIEELKKL